jgi:hypothetical protein
VGVGGVGVFKQKTGVNLEFKNINAGSSKITVTNDVPNNEIDIDVSEGSINHDGLLNFFANEHIDHSTVYIVAGNGLSGTADITANVQLQLDINELTVDATPDSGADYVATYDASTTTHKKVLLSTLITSFQNYQQNSDDTETSTTSTAPTFTQKLRLTTNTLVSGNYIITWYYEWKYTSNTTDFLARVQLNDTTTIMEHQQEPSDAGTDQAYVASGWYYGPTLSGVYNIDLDFARNGGGTSYMRRARLSIWRVS